MPVEATATCRGRPAKGATSPCNASVSAAAPSKGFYYYHSGMSGLSLDMEQFLIAAADKIPNLSGMKFNSADMYEFQRCLRVNNRQFDIPFGVDEFLPAGLACGTVGAVGSTYNYAAPLYHRLIDSFNRGDHQDVAACMDKVIAIIRILVQYGGVAAGKLAMQLHGIDVGDPRRPLIGIKTQKWTKFNQKIPPSCRAGAVLVF